MVSSIRQILKLIAAVSVSLSAGITGSLFTAPAIDSWYAGLVKPALNPPNWIFAPVWTVLYLIMGVAAFIVWRKGFNHKYIRIALGVFIIQLAVNTLWPVVFFGMQNPAVGFGVIVILWFAIATTISTFARISKLAAWLLAPYIIWVGFASYLNYMIWRLN